MAKGFDDLIEFLLEEIALRGEQGASTSDFKDLLNRFYVQQDDDVRPDGSGRAAEGAQHADRRLQDKVWTWLTAHPDICFNGGQEEPIPSLTAFEALENQRRTTAATETPDGAGENGGEAPADAAPKLSVNEERMWLAMAGHGVDPKRIPRHEFIILSIIAAHGEKGVVQPEITRISGQDKRSVPKRTDNLAKHGYITKVHVLAKGTRTSLCTLRRFAKTQRDKKAAIPPIHARSSPEEIKAVIFQDGLLLYDKFFDILMDILQDCKIVTIEDCKRKLGITTKTWEMKSLWRSMRRLEGLGVVKKVKAQIKGYASSQKWYRCIKIVRDPTQRDRMIFVTMSLKEARKHKTEVEAGDDEDAEGDLDPAEEDEEAGASQALVQQDNDVQEIKRLPPQWDPDRPVINLLWDIIKNTGHSGATTAIIRDQGLGTFYRRPIDSILGRISDIWHISQPPHLRHFAIIRDTGQSDKYLHYVYRSHGNFQLAVDVGEAAWEVVITQPVNMNAGKKPRAKNQKNVRETIHHEYGELNEWGFPEIAESCFEGRTGMATLKDSNSTVMSSLKLLPSRGYLPKFIAGGYVRSQREASVDSDEDVPPPSSRKKPTTGDKPKRKYTRRSTNGPGPGRKKKSHPNPNATTDTHGEATVLHGGDPNYDVAMRDVPGNPADTFDGSMDGPGPAVAADWENTEPDAPRAKRPYRRKNVGKTKAAEDVESEDEPPQPGVYINPPWGKKPRDPSIKGRPKKAKVVVVVLQALKNIELDSQEFLNKVADARERSDASLQSGKNQQTAKLVHPVPASTSEANDPLPMQPQVQESAVSSADQRDHDRGMDKASVTSMDVDGNVLVAATVEGHASHTNAAMQLAPTAQTIPETPHRPSNSAEPPIFHMLDEMPTGPPFSAPFKEQNDTAQARQTPNVDSPASAAPAAMTPAPATPATATPGTVPKKRGRPRKDPNAPPRPRKSAKKNAQDTATASAANAAQNQRLLPAFFQPSASEASRSSANPDASNPVAPVETTGPKKRGRKPKAAAQRPGSPATAATGISRRNSSQSTRSQPGEGQFSIQMPAAFNPFEVMAEEYHRSYPALYTPAPEPFNPFVVAAQEHNRSFTSTPAPASSSQAPLVDSPIGNRYAHGPIPGSFQPSRATIPTPSHTNRARSSTVDSDRSFSSVRPSPLGRTSLVNGHDQSRQPSAASAIAAGASSRRNGSRTINLESASGALVPGQDHGGLLGSNQHPVGTATPRQQHQMPGAGGKGPAHHGGLYDQLHAAAGLQKSSYQSPYGQVSRLTPGSSPDAARRPETGRGPVWGSFSSLKNKPTGKDTDLASSLAVQAVRSAQKPDMLQPSPISPTDYSLDRSSASQQNLGKTVPQPIEIPDDDGSETEEEPNLHSRPVASSDKQDTTLVEKPDEVRNGEEPSHARQAAQGLRAQEDEEMQDAPPVQEDVELAGPSQVSEAPSTPGQGSRSRGVLTSTHSAANATESPVKPSPASVQNGQMPEAEDGSANPEVPIPRKKGKWLGGKKQGVKLSGGGILNFNRTKLLVSIVEKCDGVFPGDFEIHRPFVGLWNKEYGAERQVDRDTIKRTIKNAIDSRKLHRFAYSFKNKNGVMMTRHILSLPSVAQNDQLVLDTQKKVISAWPRVYTPPQMKEYEEEVGNSWYGDKYEKDTSVRVERSNLPQWMRDMELRTAENQRKREEEKSRKQEREAKGLPRVTRPGRGRGGRGRGGTPRPVLTGRTGRQRLAGLPRPAADPDDSPWTSFQSKFFGPPDVQDDEDIEEQTALSRTRSYGDMTGLFQVDNFVFHRPTHDSAVVSDDDDSSMFGTPFSSRSGTPVPATPSRRGRRRSSIGSTGTMSTPGREPTFQVQLSPSRSRRGSVVSVASSTSSAGSVSSFRIEKPKTATTQWSFKNAGPETYDPTWDIQDITTMTDPDILFYTHTGTFSTEYYVVRNSRLSLWVQPRAQHQQDFEDAMPRSLDEMKDSIKMKGKDRDHSRRGNANLSRFEREVIVVSHWEDQYMKKSEDLGLVLRQPHFINHNFYGEQEEPETEWVFNGLKWDNPYSQVFTPFEPPSFDETDESDAPDGFIAETGKGRRKTAARAPKRRRHTSAVDTPDGNAPTRTRRPRTQRTAPKSHLARAPTQDPLCVISTSDTKKLLYAMVVVQSLLGGLEGYTSWDQIRKIFRTHERWDLTSFRNRWVWLKTRCADVVENLFDEFQQAYLLAYECGDVPAIDYDNVDDYDWEGIVAWTMQNISIKPPKEADPTSNLPSNRKELDQAFTVQEINEWSGPPKESLFNESCLSTRRRELTQQYSFYLPLTPRTKPKEKPSTHLFSRKALDRAKTWVRATIVAPDEQFDRNSFGEKLKKLDDKIVSKATSELVSTKYFRDEQKGRTKPGRNYGVDRTFPRAFERQLLPAQLLDAMRFKEDLDQAFRSGARAYTISNAAKDGHVLAIINLVQSGFVKIEPALPPVDHTIGKPFPRLTKWGFTEGHYKTVQMDRGRLTWRLDIVPTERYVFGNPLLKARNWDALPPPPLAADDGEYRDFVPLWSDLFNRPIVDWWRRVVTAIVHIVFGRPGIGVDGLKRGLKDTMDEWEIELCVKWLVDVGAFEDMRLGLSDGEKTRGWRLGEWWWCVLGEEV